MKLSAGTIGTLLFTAVATAAFVWMAKRPVVEGSAMNFGMPMQSVATEEEETPEVESVPVVAPEAEAETEAPIAPESPAAPEQAEPEKTDVIAPILTSETNNSAPISMDTPVETNIEVPPATMPADLIESPIDTDKVPEMDTPISPAS